MTASEDERESVRRGEPDGGDWFQETDPGAGRPEPDHRNGGRSRIDRPADPRAQRSPEPAFDDNDGDSEPEFAESSSGRRRGGRSDQDKPVKKGSFWKELPILIIIALVLTFLIQTFIARVYVIPSGSMEQTLNGCPGCTGDRILVDKLTFDFSDPRPGDVIVFKGPPGWDQSEFNVDESNNVIVRWLRQFGSSIGIGTPPEYDLVKRVIAVGGQTVQCCDAQNRILVNGKPLTEPYVYWQPGFGGPAAQKQFPPVTIPQGNLWVMGDNRNNSDDSRYQNNGGINGVVPVSDVIGVARTIIWPPSRWRGIGETNAQAMALASAPGWTEGLPAGIGVAAAFPVFWVGKKTRRGLRDSRLSVRGRMPRGKRQ